MFRFRVVGVEFGCRRWLLTGLLLVFALASRAAEPAAPKWNVLFIAADDLRCDLGCYGNPWVKTPNLDRLAARGRLFARAYCQQALCNPSRASLMTGLRPDHTGVYNLTTHFRRAHPDIVTLPQLFKENGYEAVGIGKMYHNLNTRPAGDPLSWSRPQVMYWGNHRVDQPQAPGYTNVPFAELPPAQCYDVPDEAYLDGRIAAAAVQTLRELKDKPFFLGVGFWKPHLPYNAPKKYWDLYQPADLPPPTPGDWPLGAPDVAKHNSPEVRGYFGVPKQGPLSAAQLTHLRHGYLAAISFLDAQVGKVVDELDRLGLADKTIVVLWGDNGYELGEHTLFGKLSNFELDAHVPLIMAVPAQARPGVTSRSLVELVDLYPTLADLCGLTPPQPLDGVSLRPVLDDPTKTVTDGALTQHPRPVTEGRFETMGYSQRTDRFRYTEWRDWETGNVVARELYDQVNDPGETVNRADDPVFAAEVKRGEQWLAAHVSPRVVDTNQNAPAASFPPTPKGDAPTRTVPGVVIDHQPATSGLYIGSPSLALLPDGSYVASHDFFGPKGRDRERPQVVVFRSTDRGASWQRTARLDGLFWASLFVHRGALYLLGTDREYGRIVIRRSRDGGVTWTEPRGAATGLLTATGQYHTAPTPVVVHAGRLWRAFEDASNGTEWGKRFSAGMLSVPVDADLLNATNWTFSNFLPRDPAWLGGQFNAWLEGNAVVAPAGHIVDVLRVDTPHPPERAALVNLSADGRTASFAADTGFVNFPGGAKKFTIRADPRGDGYWAVASILHDLPDEVLRRAVPGSIRNTLALLHSADLHQWEVRRVLLHHPDRSRHGFQYADWQFDGDDLVAVCRTAFDDGEGGAHNFHDANFLTFHRFKDFRSPRDTTAAAAAPGLKTATLEKP